MDPCRSNPCCSRVSCILDIDPLSDIRFANIFFHPRCFFILFIASFDSQFFFHFYEILISLFFSFIVYTFGAIEFVFKVEKSSLGLLLGIKGSFIYKPLSFSPASSIYWVWGQKGRLREFPSGLVVRILGFHCCGPGSIPGRGTKILQALWCGQKKKKIAKTKVEKITCPKEKSGNNLNVHQ